MANSNQAMELARPHAGTLARSDALGETSLATSGEVQANATAALVRAQVESRYKMALARPRDIDDVRQRMLAECKRPHFAEVAVYSVPRGGTNITGPSIRFAEAALRWLTNVLPETSILYDDAGKRIVGVSVTDLEANITYTHQVVIEKTIERKKLRAGQVAKAQRTNSYGETVYIVEASDDDMLMRQNALVSKALRTLALRILPGDILDEALEKIEATREHADKQSDPAEARKKVADAFSQLGILPSQLKDFLGCDLVAASPAQRKELNGIFVAIRDGQTTWADVILERGGGSEAAAPKASQAERLRAQAIASPAPSPQQQQPEPSPPPPPSSTAQAPQPQQVQQVAPGSRGRPPRAQTPMQNHVAPEAPQTREPGED